MKAKGIFTHLSKFSAGNVKGISLIEVIVSMGILAIVTGPFLGTIILSTRNNTYSEQVLKGSEIAQSVMEEIKSRPDFLEDEAVDEEDAVTDQFKVYPLDSEYEVMYKITKNQRHLPSSSTLYDFEEISGPSFDLEFYVDSGFVYLKDVAYSLNEGLAAKAYYLDLTQTGGVYTYNFYDDTNSVSKTGMLYDISGTRPVRIRITYLNEWEKSFNLNLSVDEIEDRKVFVYLIDDEKDLFKINNTGTRPFYQFDEISTGQVGYYNVLFNIELIVKYRGEELNRIISYVKKNR